MHWLRDRDVDVYLCVNECVCVCMQYAHTETVVSFYWIVLSLSFAHTKQFVYFIFTLCFLCVAILSHTILCACASIRIQSVVYIRLARWATVFKQQTMSDIITAKCVHIDVFGARKGECEAPGYRIFHAVSVHLSFFCIRFAYATCSYSQ